MVEVVTGAGAVVEGAGSNTLCAWWKLQRDPWPCFTTGFNTGATPVQLSCSRSSTPAVARSPLRESMAAWPRMAGGIIRPSDCMLVFCWMLQFAQLMTMLHARFT